jgi:hypothetical protein
LSTVRCRDLIMAASASRPVFAAVLILRNEADNVPACFASLAKLVDEIHAYDTGSTDGTAEVAASLGAIVTIGRWADDFAAARNAALERCAADWVLSVDADERAMADPMRLRAFLADTPADVATVEIDNASDELPYTHRAQRLFRPAAATWTGRIHERLIGRGGPLRTADAPRSAIALGHLGYRTARLRGPKSRRNVTLARADLDELAAQLPVDHAAVARTLLALGRSLIGAGQRQDAVDTFEMIRSTFPGTTEWVQATDFLARLVLGAGLDDVCLVLVGQLREADVNERYCDWLEAQALAQLGQPDRAWTLLSGVTEVTDTAGRAYHPAALEELKSLLYRLQHSSAASPGV